MIDEIIKLREDGLSFRKIASELNTTVGRVQYRWNKWSNKQENKVTCNTNDEKPQHPESSINQLSSELTPLKGELQAKLISPRKIILLWQVSEIPEKIIQISFNKQFKELVQVVRVYDVTDIIFNGNNAHHFYELAVPYQNGYWVIKGLVANRNYIAELGVNINEANFFPVFRSNSVQTPTMELTSGKEIYYDLAHELQLEASPPKWLKHVSTYTYYGESKTTGPQNG